jgi:hypothetical protein
LLRRTLRVRESIQLVYQPFRMNPAQRVLANVELTGIVAQHHGALQKAMRMDAAPLSPLGGDQHRVLDDRQTRRGGRDDAKAVQMRLPRRLINEARVASIGQTRDQGAGQSTAAQVAERRLVHHVVGMSRPQQIKKVQPGLG